MPFPHVPALQAVRELVRQCFTSLAGVDRTTREGKALDQVQQRLVGFYGITGMEAKEGVQEPGMAEIRLTLFVSRPLTREEKVLIHRILDEVNQRFAVHITAAV